MIAENDGSFSEGIRQRKIRSYTYKMLMDIKRVPSEFQSYVNNLQCKLQFPHYTFDTILTIKKVSLHMQITKASVLVLHAMYALRFIEIAMCSPNIGINNNYLLVCMYI